MSKKTRSNRNKKPMKAAKPSSGVQNSVHKSPPEALAVPESPPQPGTFTGPEVLWRGPGQLVLGFGVIMGLTWGAQQIWFADEANADTEVVPAALPTNVGAILAEADLDSSGGAGTVGGPKMPDNKRGLVNLYKQIAGDEGEAGDPAVTPAAPAPPAKIEGAAADKADEADKAKPKAANDKQPTQDAKAAKETGEGDKKVVKIEDPNGAMKPFYDALRRTERKEAGAITRIMHWGDSVIVADMMTGTARRKLQERFGDSGHGFMLVTKPWEYYIHQNVSHSVSKVGWRNTLITKGALKDKHYGIGGVMSQALGKGAYAEWGPASKGKTGINTSKFQVFYAVQPEGGEVAVTVDGKDQGTFSTAGSALGDKLFTTTFDDGPRKIRLQSNGGPVRVYGAVLERENPGVVYDCLGITGSRASTLIRFDEPHFKRQVNMRAPDLMVVMTGSNQSKFKGMDMAQYERDYVKMVKQLRAARPKASCLIAGAPDRADKSGGALATSPLIPKIIEVQRKVALANGCAFWNTYEAMGGQNSMIAWFRHRPRLASGDYTHLTMAGGEVLGTIFYDALMASY